MKKFVLTILGTLFLLTQTSALGAEVYLSAGEKRQIHQSNVGDDFVCGRQSSNENLIGRCYCQEQGRGTLLVKQVNGTAAIIDGFGTGRVGGRTSAQKCEDALRTNVTCGR